VFRLSLNTVRTARAGLNCPAREGVFSFFLQSRGQAVGPTKPFVQFIPEDHLALKATVRNYVRVKYWLFSTYCTRINQLRMLVANKMRRYLLWSVGTTWSGSGCGLLDGKYIAMTAVGCCYNAAHSALNQNVYYHADSSLLGYDTVQTGIAVSKDRSVYEGKCWCGAA
jgi:hypothetical protein